ncbi:MAG: putative bifunctional diguanylate cyclase/phosphodiesterase [Gaiellaceae bacterium]
MVDLLRWSRSRRLWALLLLAAVGTASSAGIGHFRTSTDRARRAEYVLLTVRGELFAAEADANRESPDRTPPRPRPFVSELAAAGSDLRLLERTDPPTAAAARALASEIAVYRRVALRRLTALRHGQPQLAATIDERDIAPALAALGRLSDRAVRASDKRRAASEARAVLGIRLIVFSVAVVMLLALSLWGRARRLAERSELEQEILKEQVAERQHEAQHDDLTGLLNRRGFFAALHRALEAGDAREVAVLLLDLDGFKEINDTLGHDAGDALLVEIGARLRTVVRQGDSLARLGGDEFAIIARGARAVERAPEIGRRIRAALQVPFEVAGLALQVRASVGISDRREQSVSAEELVRRADVAMYQAKANRDNVAEYATAGDPRTSGSLRLVNDLERALKNDELVVHYQPKARLDDGSISGVEALVRWQHPQRGLLLPDTFIPTAERTGLIRQLALDVIRRALLQQAAWRTQGLDLPVAINLSIANLLDNELPAEIDRLLEASGSRPEQLRLEITESYLITDPSLIHGNLTKLCRQGMRLALGDFRTGYSSFTHLRHLPIDELKIDRSFIGNLGHDDHDVAIVRATIDLAHSLELTVVAEGVETERVWNQLRDLGCDQAQGYHLTPPLAASDLTDWLLDGARTLEYAIPAT